MSKDFILAIDTSCDDTSAAVVRGQHVLSSVVRSQSHAAYGGVFPTVAKREHQVHVAAVIDEAIKTAGVEWAQITALAVTQGPGLAPALEVGLEYAKVIADQHQLPLIPVNHLAGHVWSCWLDSDKSLASSFPAWINSNNSINLAGNLAKERINESKDSRRSLPQGLTRGGNDVLALVISGGHTEFVHVHGVNQYQRLGWTVDDAAGEALDKVGRLAGLPYPAGATIEKLALQGDAQRFSFPLPMTDGGSLNLSFAGLKTAAARLLEKEAAHVKDEQFLADFFASFQHAVFRHVTHKLQRILNQGEYRECWLGGGVAANQTLRQALQTVLGDRPLRVPPIKYCLDNAAMIGLVGWLQWQELGETVFIDPSKLDRKPSWPL